MRRRNETGQQIRLAKVLLDECMDAQEQDSLPRLDRQRISLLGALGDGGSHQVHQHRAQPGRAGRPVGLQVQGHPAKQRRRQSAGAPIGGDRNRGKPSG